MIKLDNNLVVAVLLNYNQNEFTIKCVESLLKSNYSNFIILLVDNGSTSENFKELNELLPKSKKLVTVRLENNIGYGRGTNYGLEKAYKFHPKYFLILNNDTIIDNNAVKELVATSKLNKDKARVTGKVYHYDDPKKLQFIAFKKIKKRIDTYSMIGVDEFDSGQYDSLSELDMIDDIFVLHPVKLYELEGGYSPFLWVNGVNIDISLRALSQGYKLIFCPKAKIWHKGSVSIGGRNKNPKLAYWNVQSKLILRYLHLNKFQFSLYYIRLLTNDVFRTLLKSFYLKFFKGIDITDYATAKFKAVLYFNRWLILKNHNTGKCPV